MNDDLENISGFVAIGILCAAVAGLILLGALARSAWMEETQMSCPPPEPNEYLQIRRVDDKLRGTYFAVVEYGRAQKINRIEDCGK